MSLRAIPIVFIAAVFLVGAVRAGDAADSETRILPPRRSTGATSREPKTAGAASVKKSSSTWWTTLGALAAVLALVWLAARVVQKSVPAARKSLPDEVVQVLGRKPLDYRHTIHLVRFGSRLLMLGASQDAVTVLSEITDQVEIDYLAGLCQPSEPATVSQTFQQLFRRFQRAEPDAEDNDAEGADESPAIAGPAVLRLQQRLKESAPHNHDDHDTPSPEAAG